MKKLIFIALLLVGGYWASAQAPHLFEHTYPVITAENPEIRSLMDSVSIDSIKANIEHLITHAVTIAALSMMYRTGCTNITRPCPSTRSSNTTSNSIT